MKCSLTVLLAVASLGSAAIPEGLKLAPPNREGKVFSLFNIVQFANTGCRSQSSISGAGTTSPYRNGTCYTNSECSAKGGVNSGTCAAGFGVCCVFLASASGSTISQNCTYIRNPGFPSGYLGTDNRLTYTVQKCTDNVCYLRLDFESFTTVGTTSTTELFGGVCLDTFTITTNTNQAVPTICGQNTGQHMYIDIGRDSGDTATLAFNFGDLTSSRNWEIKVTQILCDGTNAYVPPAGCLQYETGLTGSFTTFNFIPTNDNHLAKQDYSVCIRQEAGYCCIEYQPCADVVNAFTLDSTAANVAKAMTDTACSGDYVEIDASSGTCNQANNRPPVVNKYCGGVLNAFSMSKVSGVVCDCTQPFQVVIHTDSSSDASGYLSTIPNDGPSRGVCLTWMQVPCSTV